MNTNRDNDNIIPYYSSQFSEDKRLSNFFGELEFIRSKEIIKRHLSNSMIKILDVGGGPGKYSDWLVGMGHTLNLVDPVPLHVKQAKELISKNRNFANFSASVGDARDLGFKDSSFDMTLLMGPLYHLQEKYDRLKAIKESFRVLKDGGVSFFVAISKYASLLDGLDSGFLKDPKFVKIVRQDLATGKHVNPTMKPEYFTDSYFQDPFELEAEVKDAGFKDVLLIAIEGPLWADRDLQNSWNNPNYRDLLLELLRQIESERSLLGSSPHIMAVGRK